jgi:LAO/AO transport system kinase
MPGLIERLRSRDDRALARCLTLAENDPGAALGLLETLGPCARRAWVLGITGPPGVGKSTLIGQLIRRALSSELSVAVLAVDPSSPFSAGSLLADRLRMGVDALSSRGVFVRSLSNRGQSGGLSPGLPLAVRFLDHYGFDVVLVETVGIGQSEVSVMRVADYVAVVLVASLGDEVQAMKSGIMEIADLYVVNKSRIPGTDKLVGHLRSYLTEAPRFSETKARRPGVLLTDALHQDGVDALWQHLAAERSRYRVDGTAGRAGRDDGELVAQRLADRFRADALAVLRGLDGAGLSLDEMYALVARRIGAQLPGPIEASVSGNGKGAP